MKLLTINKLWHHTPHTSIWRQHGHHQPGVKRQNSPQSRPIDVLITTLNEHHLRRTYKIGYVKTSLMIKNLNTKPLSGYTLLHPVLWTVSHRFYPTERDNPENFRALQLDKYPIGIYQNHDDQDKPPSTATTKGNRSPSSQFPHE